MSPPRTIAITGVTRGLGRALAEAYRAAGHRVWGCGRSREALAALGGPPELEAVDVTDADAVAAWGAHLMRDGETPDLLVCNAALINRNAPLWEVSSEEFSQVIGVNLGGVHNTLRAFLPSMIAAGRGVVVLLSSGWGRSTAPDVAPYCATKWGIEGMASALAQELPPGLAAVALNPGIIDTEMLRSTFGRAAGAYPDAGAWVRQAAPFLLSLGPGDNGASLTVPQ